MGDKNLKMAPGFRFYPTDEQLVLHFLHRKPPAVDLIPDLDLYPHDPWDLHGKAMAEGQKCYFYSRTTQSCRITGSGYWQTTGLEDPIYSHSGQKVGVKKYCAFYIGEPSQGVKTNWIMHEYSLSTSTTASTNNINAIDYSKWVLCRVYECHEDDDDDDDDDGVELSCLDEVFLSLDDLDEITLPNN